MSYIFEHEGKQYSPYGMLDKLVDAGMTEDEYVDSLIVSVDPE